MTTLRGQTLIPRLGTEQEKALIVKLAETTRKIKKLYEEKEKLFRELQTMQGNSPIVVNVVDDDGVEETRTFFVSKPDGQYITYKQLDFVVEQKTTKDDRKTLGLEGK